MILNLFMICLILVFIIDISGFIGSVSWFMKYILDIDQSVKLNLKPFSCSLCMTFWTCLVYIICQNQFTIFNLLVISMLAMLTPVFKDALWNIRDILSKIINYIYEIF